MAERSRQEGERLVSDPQLPEVRELAKLLEEAPYIDDAGFSDRVVRALPTRRGGMVLSHAVLPAFTVVACWLAYEWSGRSFASGRPVGALSLAMTSSFACVTLALVVLAVAAFLSAED